MSPPELRVRVSRKTIEADGIFSYELTAEDGGALPAFTAGSHVDVHLPGGITRQYSLYNDPADSHRYEIAVLRVADSRGGSAAMHSEVQLGDVLRISVPRNHFALADAATDTLLLAGGIGITPILSMARRLWASAQPFTLHYSARSPSRMAFRELLRSCEFRDRIRFHFDDGPADQALDVRRLLGSAPGGVHLYVCGPQGYMEHVLGTARKLGWPEEQLHYEFFGAKPVESVNDGSFEVELASSGRVVAVETGQSVVDALEQAGVLVPTSCRQGVCGTCLTRVLAGECDHRDLYLTPEEQASNSQFLPCVSRARSDRLKLDL